MSKHKIAIIDDSGERVRAFMRDMERDFEVDEVSLQDNIEEIIEQLIEERFEALIVDFDLDTKYNGVDIINMVDEIMEGYPTFVLTAYDAMAEQDHDIKDVNKVYRKQDGPELLIRRVKKQIEIYQKTINDASEEILLLLERRDSLSLLEEERLIYLDSLIEKSVYKPSSIPVGIKMELTFESKVVELLETTAELLKELKGNS